jgi:hypothetical protein
LAGDTERNHPPRQPRCPRLSRGPVALRPRLTTGMPLLE